jgi:hypothetical protein
MNIIVSFSTLPSRIGRIMPMIDSIIGQTMHPTQFVMCLPLFSQREQCKYVVPDDIPNAVTRLFCDIDYGPATKLVPTLNITKDDDIIITVDDDVVYEPHLIEELVDTSIKYPNTRLGFMGSSDGRFVHSEYCVDELTKVDTLGGYRGILYRRNFIKCVDLLSLIYHIDNTGMCRCDDQVFQKHVEDNGFVSCVIRTKYPKKFNAMTQLPPWQNIVGHEIIGLNFTFLDLGNGVNDGSNAAKTGEAIQILRNEAWVREDS